MGREPNTLQIPCEKDNLGTHVRATGTQLVYMGGGQGRLVQMRDINLDLKIHEELVRGRSAGKGEESLPERGNSSVLKT